MNCTCNGFSMCDEHYRKNCEKYWGIIIGCIDQLLKQEPLSPLGKERICAVSVSSCETLLGHEGTMQILRTASAAKSQGCSEAEIKEIILERVKELNEYKNLVE